ncbi:MAG: hypothetical protein IK103_05485 [Bacteroidales bacterium]|nr:hypothetical protein [Bacteroidales bacterium]
MKKILYLIAFAGCAAMLFSYCKNNTPNTEGTNQDTESAIKAAAPDTLDVMNLYATADNLTITPPGLIRDAKDALSGEAIEIDVTKAWRKLSIVVPGQETSDVPDMKAILKAIAEVYPMPMLLACVNGNTKGTIVEDEANHFISYVEDFYENADYKDNCRLKAWQFFEDETWAIGLAYHRLWDGDDGIGVYQNLMFWKYDPKGDKVLRPLNGDEYFLPEYTPQRGLVVFHANGDNIDFDGGADPDLFWKWTGHWFESSAPQQ